MIEQVDCGDAEVMRIWRERGLPEHFLGNRGTNWRLLQFAECFYNGGIEAAAREIEAGAEDRREFNISRTIRALKTLEPASEV